MLLCGSSQARVSSFTHYNPNKKSLSQYSTENKDNLLSSEKFVFGTANTHDSSQPITVIERETNDNEVDSFKKLLQIASYPVYVLGMSVSDPLFLELKQVFSSNSILSNFQSQQYILFRAFRI